MDKDLDIHDPTYVKDLFDRVSSTYGYTNYLASFGFTERWRKACVLALGALPREAVGFDLMCGRGETWRQLFAKQRSISRLTALDISPEMIEGARQHARTLGAGNVDYLEVDVFENTIPSGSADFVISTFGVKTFNRSQLAHLAREINRILKVGGVFSVIEVSDPKGWWLRGLYLFYLRRIMPIIERLFLGYSYGFSMIGVYVERFGDCAELNRYFEEQGLDVELRRYFYGCATGLSGVKPHNDRAQGA